MWLFLLACAGGANKRGESLTTTDLWPDPTDRYQVYRMLDKGADPAADTGTLGDGTLQAQFSAGGCGDGGGTRVELREGEAWAEASPAGALHFSAASGLALCAFEDDAGETTLYDPPVTLWEDGSTLTEGEVTEAGAWSSAPTGVIPVVTYYGTFGSGVAFLLSGPGGDPSGWTLTFAQHGGLVIIGTGDYTADLLYFR